MTKKPESNRRGSPVKPSSSMETEADVGLQDLSTPSRCQWLGTAMATSSSTYVSICLTAKRFQSFTTQDPAACVVQLEVGGTSQDIQVRSFSPRDEAGSTRPGESRGGIYDQIQRVYVLCVVVGRVHLLAVRALRSIRIPLPTQHMSKAYSYFNIIMPIDAVLRRRFRQACGAEARTHVNGLKGREPECTNKD